MSRVRIVALPAEVWVIGAFSGFWLAGLPFFPINLPDRRALDFIHAHFFAPVEIAVVLQLIFVAWLSWRRKMTNARMPLMSVGLLFFTVASVFLHFNFKAWMPFANPIIYDAAFAKIDQALGPLVDSLRAFRTWVADSAPVSVDSLYHNGFVAMFFVSFIAHSLFDKPWAFRRMAMSVNLVLLVGGISYWLFPAIGPFLYAPGLNQDSTEAQRLMILGLRDALASGYLPSGYFVNPPAAMPSLHVAHAVLFTTFAWRWSPALAADLPGFFGPVAIGEQRSLGSLLNSRSGS